MKQILISSLDDLDVAAKSLIDEYQDHNVFAIEGKMGAGKTTFIKSVCNYLGVTETVSSPTFALVNEYSDRNRSPVYHFDFYRIKRLDEVYDIGYEEYFYSQYKCFVEWPEMVTELLPKSYVYVHIKENEDGSRTISHSLKNA
jgi:tRNA threonylcarbamoyladenosine biosynthesis protein TsaE